MSIFDLVFILAFFASVATLLTIVVSFARGRRQRARRLLITFAGCAAVYFLFDGIVAFVKPQRVIAIGTPWCFDEWCLTVEDVKRIPVGESDTVDVHFRLSSQALRRPQRANGAWIYLVDDRGNRYAPEPDPADVPLNTLLQPQQAMDASRTFKVAAHLQQLGLVTGHGGPYCGAMSVLIIGAGGCLFHKPTMIRIQ